MKFTDLRCCPFCGGEVFYQKGYAKGTTEYMLRFDGKEAHNEEMYDGLLFKYSSKAYCRDCDRYLGNVEQDVVGKAAQKALN